jgi:hypothetical protein
MSATMLVLDQVQHYTSLFGTGQSGQVLAAVQENCTIVEPVRAPFETLIGAVLGLIKWVARLLFVVFLFSLLIPNDTVRKISIGYIAIFLLVALFAPGLIGLGDNVLPGC